MDWRGNSAGQGDNHLHQETSEGFGDVQEGWEGFDVGVDPTRGNETRHKLPHVAETSVGDRVAGDCIPCAVGRLPMRPDYIDKGASMQGSQTRPGLVVSRREACNLLQPVFALMKDMDRNGRMGMQMLVVIHWNKKLLKILKTKIGFVNTKRLEWETPEDFAPYDGFMQDIKYDQEEAKRRAANWCKSRGHHDRGTTVVDVDDEELSHDSVEDDELVRVKIVDKRSTRRSGGGSSSSSQRDDITKPEVLASGRRSAGTSALFTAEEGVRSRRRTSILGGAALLQGTAPQSGAQLTHHRRLTLEEIRLLVQSLAPVEADALIGVRGDDLVGERRGDDPIGATAAHDDGVVGADTETDDGPIASGDVFSTPDPGLRLGERFASLLPYVNPIALRGSAQDFGKHLASMSPVRTDNKSNTPDWARFTEPTTPTRRLNEDIQLVAGERTHTQVDRRTPPVQDGGTTPPHDMNARSGTVSPPHIDKSKVRQLKSLAGRKKGGKKRKGRQRQARREMEEGTYARLSRRPRPWKKRVLLFDRRRGRRLNKCKRKSRQQIDFRNTGRRRRRDCARGR
ncbi:hypothetical protein CBR_g34241 [Chara braunii]|uniref:Uncharacterized protein n=1 Tax=Chara braunii TaxID=69332 RepID=A0A388JYI4_CHABU|nr:hypothetical protein CBR_g34241 [Chara braunii]|eukprot:GBG62869.1 hypothetical protein CBR_g34241 [Chara braunii]